jgi:Arc/MetJ family transcription regulator
MVRYHLTTKREAVDYALRSLVGSPMTTQEAIAMAGAYPDFEVPPDDDDDHHLPG